MATSELSYMQVALYAAQSLQLHSNVSQACPDLFVKCAHIL